MVLQQFAECIALVFGLTGAITSYRHVVGLPALEWRLVSAEIEEWSKVRNVGSRGLILTTTP